MGRSCTENYRGRISLNCLRRHQKIDSGSREREERRDFVWCLQELWIRNFWQLFES
jgi:hypothetical protein